jgi:hypothetical protein
MARRLLSVWSVLKMLFANEADRVRQGLSQRFKAPSPGDCRLSSRKARTRLYATFVNSLARLSLPDYPSPLVRLWPFAQASFFWQGCRDQCRRTRSIRRRVAARADCITWTREWSRTWWCPYASCSRLVQRASARWDKVLWPDTMKNER